MSKRNSRRINFDVALMQKEADRRLDEALKAVQERKPHAHRLIMKCHGDPDFGLLVDYSQDVARR